MKRKNILAGLVLLLAAGFSASSCSDWLDVAPKAQQEADKLFETQDGFKEVLAGCYTGLIQKGLYGQEMTFGAVGMLGQEWGSGQGLDINSSAYYNLLRYKYDNAAVIPYIDSIWSKMYNVIAQVNTLIDYTEKKKSVLNDLNYSVIRGEALALRAFAHADLFRLYADVRGMQPDPDKVSLPYMRGTEPKVTPQATNKIFYENIIKDIDNALTLLVNDPIYSGQDMSSFENGYYANRNYHLNYYAALALKARISLYWGDKTAALAAAKTVIEAQEQKGLFRWITINEVNNIDLNQRDRTFSTEHIFAFNSLKLENYVNPCFRESDPLMSRLTTKGGANPLFITGDYRGVFFETHNGKADVFSKFWQMPNTQAVRPPRDRMPAIRISEMYYIAAECQMTSNPSEALRLLNTVRLNRGLQNPLTPDVDLKAELLKEYQREFLGEGQLFFYHKRHNTTNIATANADYILPLPDSEWEFGNRQPIKE